MRSIACAVLAAAALAGCSSAPETAEKPYRTVAAASAEEKKALWDPLAALAGEWTMTTQKGETVLGLRVEVTSGGTTIREAIFPDSEGEMVNLYTMDGASVLMTHYCHVGNQPRMRATKTEGGTWAFDAAGCGNLTSADGGFMGSMTLKIRDADHIEQAWFWHEGGKVAPGPVIVLTRKK